MALGRTAKKNPLRTQDDNMTRLDADVNILANRQRLHCGATGDQMLLAPADVNLGEISLEDRLFAPARARRFAPRPAVPSKA